MVKTKTDRYIYRKPNINFEFLIKELPWTPKQQNCIKLLQDRYTKCALIQGPAGSSKAQPLYSKILTPNGETTMGELKIGDKIFDRMGNPTEVIGIFPQGKKKIYKISFSDQTSTECCEDHLWLTWDYKERNYRTKKEPSVKSLKEIKNSLYARNGSHLNHKIPICSPLSFNKQDLPIDPYILGILLGDGGLKYQIMISSKDSFILSELEQKTGCELHFVSSSNCDYRITYPNVNNNPLKDELIKLKCNVGSLDKFIPNIYLYSSIEDRISLLRGLMDTDGTISYGKRKTATYESFSSSSKQLANGVKFLIQSLGGTATISEHDTYYYNSEGEKIEGKLNYNVNICMNPNINPFLLPRKANKYIPKTKYTPRRYITNVEEIGEEECQCILVNNPEHLYLTNDCIVTHNTIVAIYCGLQLLSQKKISDITYVRSVVESGSTKLGYLPGDINDKFEIYMTPLKDKLEELIPENIIKSLQKGHHIQALPVNYMRGLHFSGRLIIVDEASNMTKSELTTIITRIGEYSRVWFLGDPDQSDLTNGHKQDFNDFCKIFSDKESERNGIKTFNFEIEDIVRSEFCKFVVKKLQSVKTFIYKEKFKNKPVLITEEWQPTIS